MQLQMMCHGHTQTGKTIWAHSHNSRYPERRGQHTTRTSLQAFCDASETAMVLCLSGLSQRRHRLFNLQSPKCEVTPIKPSTLPRL